MTPMSDDPPPRRAPRGPRALRPLTRIGGMAASAAMRPLSGAASVAVDASLSLERRLVDNGELERLLGSVLDSPRTQAAIDRVMASPAAQQVVDGFFESGLFDEFIDRLLASPALWRLVDEIAASPAVSAAITQQSLGFVDQIEADVRTRSSKADVWLARLAARLASRRGGVAPPRPALPGPDKV